MCWCHTGGGGVLPPEKFGLNDVKSCNFTQNKHGNSLSRKPVIIANTMKREQTFDYMRYQRFNENIIT